VREPDAFAQRDTGQDSIAVSGQEPDSVAGQEPVSGHEPESVAGHEPDSGADPVPLAGHLPEQAVAVRLDDVRQGHLDIPPGRSVGADAHLDDV
jgi:hypothetical protein